MSLEFSITNIAAWAPGLETLEAWRAWALNPVPLSLNGEPGLKQLPMLLRRRASFAAKMALEVAYQCLGEHKNIPSVFCSKHGEVERSIQLLKDLANAEPLSPTAFGLSVHNAAAGLFSIARQDQANTIALCATQNLIEHGIVEACGLLAEGETKVLLVVYDCALPLDYTAFHTDEQPYALALLLEPAGSSFYTLNKSFESTVENSTDSSLEVLRFLLLQNKTLLHNEQNQTWQWSYHA